jgi:hypothetical protein
VYDAHIDAGTACRGFYRSADKKTYIHTALGIALYPKVPFTTTSVTLCGQSGTVMSLHSMCMMYTWMLEQLVPVPTALLTRRHTYTLNCVACFTKKVHFTTTSVTLCGQSGAVMSMHSMCMMCTLMLEQCVVVSTAVLTRRHTYTLHCVVNFSIKCTLQPLV